MISVRIAQLESTTRQLAVMVSAGLPVERALRVLGRGHTGAGLRRAWASVARDLRAGEELAEGLRRHPRHFDPLYVSVLRAGERSGSLEPALRRVGDTLARRRALRTRLMLATLYPAVVAAVALGVTALLLAVAVPAFVRLYGGFGRWLPLPTRLLIAASEGLTSHALDIAGLVAVAILSGWLASRRRAGALLAGLWLRVPFLGPLTWDAGSARFSHALAMTLAAGLPFREGLRLAAPCLGLGTLSRAAARVAARVDAGEAFHRAVETERLLPPLAGRILEIGERTGALDSALLRVAEHHEARVREATDRITALATPLLMLFLGGIVLFMFWALYLPLIRVGCGFI